MADDSPTDLLPVKRGPSGIVVQIGRSRWTIPVLTVLAAVVGALGTAYRVMDDERTEVWAAIGHLQKAQQATEGKLDVSAVTLANIQVQLARIDARVAEVQVTLMRGGR